MRDRCHAVLDEKNGENKATRRSERKRSLVEEISTIKGEKERSESDSETLKRYADD